MRIKLKDGVFILTMVMLMISAYTTAEYYSFEVDAGVAIIISTSLIILVIFEIYRRQAQLIDEFKMKLALSTEAGFLHTVQEIQSHIFIYDFLKPKLPLPLTGGWAASSDFLGELVSVLTIRKPDFVLDLGSGVTTLVAAYCLEKNGKGNVVSLDHDPVYAEKTRKNLAAHGLSHRAEVKCVSLVKAETDHGRWEWYDSVALESINQIDVLIVDGPPGTAINSLARYPALPTLYSRMSADAVILMDDGARPDEKTIAELWVKEFPDFKLDYIPLKKGLFVLRRA